MTSELHLRLDVEDPSLLLGSLDAGIGYVIGSDHLRLEFLGFLPTTRQVGAVELLLFALSFPVSLSASFAAERLSHFLRSRRVSHAELVILESREVRDDTGILRHEKRKVRAIVPLDVGDRDAIMALVKVLSGSSAVESVALTETERE